MGQGRLTCGLLALLVVMLGCNGAGRDDDEQRRAAWIANWTNTRKEWVRDALSRAGDSPYHDILYSDGWYQSEYDPKTGGSWRWQGKHSVTRLRTKPGGLKAAVDMELVIFGWPPHELIPVRESRLELAVNGYILGRLDPPARAFEHTLFVPRFLLERSDWVDFTITAANTHTPAGDWRDLGFATTGFHWKPAPAK